jgi:hypothetical protein
MVETLQQVAKQAQWRAQVAAILEALPRFAYGSATYDPPNIANNAQAQTTVTVTGAALGNYAIATFSLDLQGMVINASVSAPDTVTVTIRNNTGGAIDLASGTLSAGAFI